MTTPRPQAEHDERNLVSARLLVDLVQNTLDPGYAAAAKRRGPDRRVRWYERPMAALGALLIGFLLVVAYLHTNRGAPEAQRVHDRLVERVRAAENNNNGLAKNLAGVQETLAAAQAAALPSSGALARDLSGARLSAGETPVTGPGLVVTLGEPPAPSPTPDPGRVGSVPITQSHILSDRDVRSVVNELWADGAEAIAVNGIRLTPTSAIRFAGEAVLVDFQPVSSPYRIEAIGNAGGLATNFAQSSVASRYQTKMGAQHIGFSFRNEDHLDLPGSTAITPRFASPVPTKTRGSR